MDVSFYLDMSSTLKSMKDDYMKKKIYRLIKSEKTLSAEELEHFCRGNLSEDPENNEELKRFDTIDEARAELAKLKSVYDEDTSHMIEYAIDEVTLDADGNIVEYGECELSDCTCYAVLEDDEDDVYWDDGYLFKSDAIEMAREIKAKYIGVIINNESKPVCIEKIPMNYD